MERHFNDALFENNAQFNEPYPWLSESGEVIPALQEIFQNNRGYIFANPVIDDVRSVYNRAVIANDQSDAQHWWQEICNFFRDVSEMHLENAYKCNFSFGYILEHRETHELRYYVAGENDPYYPTPVLVRRPDDMMREFTENATPQDLWQHVFQSRPSTKWVPLFITNVTIFLYHINYALGCGTELPEYIKSCHCIIALDKNVKGKVYTDMLCAFRCLAVHKNLQSGKKFNFKLESQTIGLAKSFPQWSQGISIFDLPRFENEFSINVDVYSLTSDQTVIPRYLSDNTHGDDKMVLNMSSDNHLSYVKNIDTYLSRYKCGTCSRIFNHLGHLKSHMKCCLKRQTISFPGGHYKLSLNLSQKLERSGIDVPPECRHCKSFATFDCESILDTDHADVTDHKTEYFNAHIPVSVSIASNIDGHRDPVFICEKDPDDLTSEFLRHLHAIKTKAKELNFQHWSDVLDQLKKKIKDNEGDIEVQAGYRTLLDEVERYCSQLVVLGYNSQNYDINLLKPYLFKRLDLDEGDDSDDDHGADDDADDDNHKEKNVFVIKKNSGYMSIITHDFRFLDVSNFLAPGTSLANFYRAFNAENRKLFFPYEKITSYDVLIQPCEFPMYDDFYSKLRSCNVLERHDDPEVDGKLTPSERKDLGQDNYTSMKQLWSDENMTCLRDLLCVYNNADVVPFIQATETMSKFYFEQDIDLFMHTFSVPGAARIMLLKSALESGASIPLINEIDADLYHTMKANITGGPAIVYHRYAEVGKTYIRDNPEYPVKLIRGDDCNALYPTTYLKEYPCEMYIRRHAPHFTATGTSWRHEHMFLWMNFVAMKTGCKIQHKRNTGSEVKIGKYFVDGFCAVHKEVFEYDGCYWHQNDCAKCKKADTAARRERKKYTVERSAYIQQQGYTLIKITDHEFEDQCKKDAELKRYIDTRMPPFFRDNSCFKRFTESAIIEAIQNEKLYGFAEVDIDIPDHLYQMFHEMPPLFCTVSVPFSEWGDLMQTVAQEQGLSLKPRTQLVGGMAARKIMLATPLLKWYLDHGLRISRIYQIVEYTPMACFANFARTMTQARRAGDVCKSKSVIADTCKLLANSSYGSLLLDRSRHCDVVFTTDAFKARALANDPNFKKSESIADGLYEIQMLKSRMKLDLPVHLGLYLLQMAKLHMLRYHYDVFDRYIPRERYQLLCADTDSVYYALSTPTLEAAVRQELLQEYRSELYGYCDDKFNDVDNGSYFTRQCCAKHVSYDKRTLGRMKVEAVGNCLIALCAKTYVLRKENNDVKISSKGLSKKALEDPVSTYKSVLNTKISAGGCNTGIKLRKNVLVTYKQYRGSISYFYIKRTVRADGLSTDPLSMVLCPRPVSDVVHEVVDKSHPLHPGQPVQLHRKGNVYNNVATLLTALTAEGAEDELLILLKDQYVSSYRPPRDALLVFPRFERKLIHEHDLRRYHRSVIKYWTSGLSEFGSGDVTSEQFQGQNNLGIILGQVLSE